MRWLPFLLLLLAAPAHADSGTMASAIGDFDADGRADIAVLRGERLDLLAADGQGGFCPPRRFGEGNRYGVIGRMPVLDLDADGRDDLLVLGLDGGAAFRGGTLEQMWANRQVGINEAVLWPHPRKLASLEDDVLSVFHLGAGGALGTPTVHPLPATGWTMQRTGDTLALGTVGSPDAMLVRLRSGRLVVDRVPMGTEVGGLASADFNGDGDLDYVSLLHPLIRVRNGRDGRFTDYPADTVVSAGEVADFDGDGLPDVATILPAGPVLLSGTREGVITSPRLLSGLEGATHLAAGDLDADGRPDLVLTFIVRDKVAVLFNEGGGRFRTVTLPMEP